MSVPKDSNGVIVRVVLLAGLVVIFNLWLHRHFRSGLDDPGPLSFLAAFITSIGVVVEWFLGDKTDPLREKIRQIANGLVSTALLIVAFAVAAIVMACYSSVVVIPGEGNSGEGIELWRVADRQEPVTRYEDPPQFVVKTGAFGADFELRAPGYLPEIFQVYPLLGRTIRMGQDLRPAPSVLFRPPYEALGFLSQGGKFVLYDNSQPQPRQIIEGSCPKECSFLVGQAGPLSSAAVQMWTWELGGKGLGQQETSRAMGAWNRPTVLPLELQPGMKLRAVVTTPVGGEGAVVEWDVTTERIADVPMAFVAE